jgi:signal transduction histidine kinase
MSKKTHQHTSPVFNRPGRERRPVLAVPERSETQRAEERARYRSAMLEKVIQLGKTVTAVTDLRTILLRIWEGVRRELDFDRMAIFLYNPYENVMEGTYGTDRNGNFSEIWDIKLSLDADDPFYQLLSQPNGFHYTRDFETDSSYPPDDRMVGVTEHVSVAVSAGDTPVAVITADQLLTQRPISEEQIEALRLFAGYAGLAIQNARLNDRERSRQAMLEKVIRLGKLVTEEADYRTVLLRIYNCVRDGFGFDRLGVFVYDPNRQVIHGSLGTDRSGKMIEEWETEIPLTGAFFYASLIARPDGYYFTSDYEKEIQPPPGDIMSGVKFYAAVSAWKNDQPIAILSVDQLVSGREITEEQLEALRLFAGYAGLAIENARLGELERSRQAMLEKVIRLGKMVNKVADYRTVLLRIWNGVRSELGFDRLGLFVYEPETNLMFGSFGTDRDGNLTEEWNLQFALDGEDFFSKIFNRPDSFFFTQDYEKEVDYVSGTPMAGVKYYAAVSAWAGDKPVACICVDQLVSGREITEEQLEALRLFAGYAGLAIENARLGRREHSRQVMLEKVIDLGKRVTGEGAYRTVLLGIFNGVRTELGFDRLGLFIYEASSQLMRGSFGTDRNGQMVEEWQLEFPIRGESFFSKVVTRPDGYFFTSDFETERKIHPQDPMHGVKYYAAVSAWAGDKPVAILCVDQLVSGREITDEQLEALRLFAGYAGLAIENARLKAELEQRVQERTAELENANRELESFSYSISHDLRAPLRAINGFSRILNDEFSTELNPLALGYLRKIGDSGEKMGRLIDDLLDFSRLGRKPLVSQPVEMLSLVQAVLETLTLETTGRQIEWVFSELPVANADPILIQQVYANLIGNALKYSRKREQAQIEIGSLTQAGEVVYFVRDNGAGFDMQYADRLFGVFQRLHREEDFEGTGIGLAIVQRIVQRHGGRVWAEGVVNQGATFYFTIGSV